MAMENDHSPAPELEPREPTVEDLVCLCRELNRLEARYVVIGGFAIRAAGFVRQTMDVDLIVDASLENEARVFKALSSLPDNAVRELEPGDLDKYIVLRVVDEVVVDLMKTAGGLDYARAAAEVTIHNILGVRIPFASPSLLWRLKAVTHREKDQADLLFLRNWFQARNQTPPGD